MLTPEYLERVLTAFWVSMMNSILRLLRTSPVGLRKPEP